MVERPGAVGGHDRLQGGSDVAAVGLGQAVRTTPAGVLPANMVPHPREELFSVLVVDDHPLLREAIAARLTQMGAGTVHEAATVAEARARALATGPCDLAILDLASGQLTWGVVRARDPRAHGEDRRNARVGVDAALEHSPDPVGHDYRRSRLQQIGLGPCLEGRTHGVRVV